MSSDMIPLLTKALSETVYMVAVSMVIASIIGVPLGVRARVGPADDAVVAEQDGVALAADLDGGLR